MSVRDCHTLENIQTKFDWGRCYCIATVQYLQSTRTLLRHAYADLTGVGTEAVGSLRSVRVRVLW
jgi:hypothetical protein